MNIKVKQMSYIVMASVMLSSGISADCAENEVNEEVAGLQTGGFFGAVNALGKGINSLSSFCTGEQVVYEPFVCDNEGEIVPESVSVPLRMCISGNNIIKIRNRARQILFFEVLSDEASGGRALYEDDRGEIQEVKWDSERIIYSDSHPAHNFLNIIVPGNYEVENVKSLKDMIGSTSTVVSRNGHGGIIKSKGGSIAEQLLALQALSEQIISHLPENTEQEIKCLRDSFFTGLSLVNNSVTLLHKEVETLDQSVDSVVVVLSQILQFLKDSKIILPCVNEDKVAD